jgi:hypothetical protein
LRDSETEGGEVTTEEQVREIQFEILAILRSRAVKPDMRRVKQLRATLGVIKPGAAMYYKFDPVSFIDDFFG